MGVWKKFHRWLFFAAYHINVGKRFEEICGTPTGAGVMGPPMLPKVATKRDPHGRWGDG
jgi:hypothetical protein